MTDNLATDVVTSLRQATTLPLKVGRGVDVVVAVIVRGVPVHRVAIIRCAAGPGARAADSRLLVVVDAVRGVVSHVIVLGRVFGLVSTAPDAPGDEGQHADQDRAADPADYAPDDFLAA